MIPSYLESLLNHEDSFVAETAALLCDISAQYEAGKLSSQEYQELVTDLTSMQRIDELTTDLERRSTVAKVFQQLYSILGSFGGFLL